MTNVKYVNEPLRSRKGIFKEMRFAHMDIDAKELLRELGISYPTLQRYKKDGLPFKKQGRRDMFNLEEVKKWLAARTRSEQQEIRDGAIKEALQLLRSLTEAEQAAVIRELIMTRKEAIEKLQVAGQTVDELVSRKVIIQVARGIFLRSSVDKRLSQMKKRSQENG